MPCAHAVLISPQTLSEFEAGGTAGSSSASGNVAGTVSGEGSGEAEEAPMEVSEENRKPQVAKRPNTPSKAEVDSHLPLHL